MSHSSVVSGTNQKNNVVDTKTSPETAQSIDVKSGSTKPSLETALPVDSLMEINEVTINTTKRMTYSRDGLSDTNMAPDYIVYIQDEKLGRIVTIELKSEKEIFLRRCTQIHCDCAQWGKLLMENAKYFMQAVVCDHIRYLLQLCEQNKIVFVQDIHTLVKCTNKSIPTANDFKVIAKKHNITRWPIFKCSICSYSCGYVFDNKAECVYYDRECDCTNYGVTERPLLKRSWEDVLEHYSMQSIESTKREYAEFWHIGQAEK